MKSILTIFAAAGLSLAAPAAAEAQGYGANYYFYGPSTNYFGQAAPSYAPGAYSPQYAPQAYSPMPAYYGGYYDDWSNPPEAYDAIRSDPWHGYDEDCYYGY